jgi:hypothetical protein
MPQLMRAIHLVKLGDDLLKLSFRGLPRIVEWAHRVDLELSIFHGAEDSD